MKTGKTLLNFFALFYLAGSIGIGAQEKLKGVTWEDAKLAEQIPETTISSMSTEELIQAYLDSRYPGYLLAYNSIQDAFEQAYNDFNGLRELLKRDDASKKLIEFYQKMDPTAYDPAWDLVKIGSFTFSFVFIEALLAHESIHEKLTKSEVKTLITELVRKNELKTSHPEIFSIIGIQFNTYSIARLLESKGKDSGISEKFLQGDSIRYLLQTGRLKNNNILIDVLQEANKFLTTY